MDHLATTLTTCLVSSKACIVSLTSNLRLYLNERLLSNECTSVLVYENFLMFTNSAPGTMHELHIYDLNRKLPESHESIKKHSAEGDFNVRAVERGSRLVVSSACRLVL